MNHADWLSRWKERRINFHLPHVNPELERFAAKLLQPAAGQQPRVLVPLCGKTLDIGFLRDQGAAVVGSELSPIAIEELYAERGLQPHIEQHGSLTRYQADDIEIWGGDIFELGREQVGPLSAAFDRAALVALPPETRRRYSQLLTKLLPQGAQLLLVSYTYPQDEMAGPPFSVPQSEVNQLFGDNFAVERLDSVASGPGLDGLRERVSDLTQQVYLARRS